MNRHFVFLLISAGCAASAIACSSSTTTPDDAGASASADGGALHDAATATDATSPGDAGTQGPDSSIALTTIAAAIQGNVTTPITVKAIVTAEHGSIPSDVSEWYIEDLDGGANSGVVVYCDPDKTNCPTIRAPGRWTLVEMTGALSPYKGQMEFIPTAQTILSDAGTPPPIPTVAMSDLAPTATSAYRGVLVKVATGTILTVDNVTPAALLDTSCTTILAPDGGSSDAGPDGGAVDAGPGIVSCATACEPPAYSGFTANDGKGNEINIEATFFATDPLQSSPECLTQPGVTPVTAGMTFSSMEGVLDFDPYAQQQQLSPVTPSDYATP
jgi:hypothetical protein